MRLRTATAACLPRQRRQGPCHCRLHRGDTARSQTCACVQQPRLSLQRQRRQGPCHCRLHRGDTARSQICDCVQQPGLSLPRQRRHGPCHCRLYRSDTARSQVCDAYVNRGLAYEKLADFARARSDFNATLGLSQEGTKWAQDKARERLAALSFPPQHCYVHCTGAE